MSGCINCIYNETINLKYSIICNIKWAKTFEKNKFLPVYVYS